MEADFSGYATKIDLECSDGRTIKKDAFAHHDGAKVPLVWQHQHNEPGNVLGHAILEAREDGVYARGFFNKTQNAQELKLAVQHGDLNMLSIYANRLKQKGNDVIHGIIREVSIVLAGANPGAVIDNVRLVHADGGYTDLDDEAVIHSGILLEHADEDEGEDMGAEEKTVKDVFETLDQEQKDVVYYMIGEALADKDSAEHSDSEPDEDDTSDDEDDEDDEDKIEHNDKEGSDMGRNVFDNSDQETKKGSTLTHDQLTTIMEEAKQPGQTVKSAFLAHAEEYGIGDIDTLFPDPKTLQNTPELISRQMEWVAKVINGVKKNPFSRIKTISADITQDEARAKGYIKGHYKKEEWFGLNHRVTTPTTIYKKQKLDRDDIVDITDLDVVAWLKAEMRLMLNEEIARAILLGDGREVDDEDKVNESNIRPIAHDDPFYTHPTTIAANVAGDAIVEAILRARKNYRGSGNPTMFCTEDMLTDLLLVKDKLQRRLYTSQADLATALRVKEIVTVEVMEEQSTDDGAILAILVNLSDYTMGADKGGAISMFDDFDIDYNQYKYLMETRMSGALTKFKSAMVFTRATGATLVESEVPGFNAGTGVVTIPSVTGVTYTDEEGTELSSGAQAALAPGESAIVEAVADEGYFFAHNTDNDWTFTRDL